MNVAQSQLTDISGHCDGMKRATIAIDNNDSRERLHRDAECFVRIMQRKGSRVDDMEELVSTQCCRAQCMRDLAWTDFAIVRGTLVQLCGTKTTRKVLRKKVNEFIAMRVRMDSIGAVNKKVLPIDTSINGKTVCMSLFLRTLGIKMKMLRTVLRGIKSGRSVLFQRTGIRVLHRNTIKAIARVAVDVHAMGQYNPTGNHVMLGREVRKKHYLRASNTSSYYLSRQLLKMYVGVSVHRRGAISFLTCKICRALSNQVKSLRKISDIMKTDVGRYVPSVSRVCPTLVGDYKKEARKAVLIRLIPAYKSAASRIARRRKVDVASVPANEVVPDSVVVNDDLYVAALNANSHVKVSKAALLEMEAAKAVQNEVMHAAELARRGRLDELEVCEDGSELLKRNSIIDSTTVEYCNLLNIHHEHIRTERMLTDVAHEMAVTFPGEVIALQYDACGKDKTKLPTILEKDKTYVPAKALMCPLLTWQVAVPTTNHNGVSRYTYKNFDYVIPFTYCEKISTDAMISTLIDLLLNQLETKIPPIMTIVLDNGSSNKSIGTIRALSALLEMIPGLKEIHLYFPTVGHTHGSVDRHFAIITKRIRAGNVLTVQDLVKLIHANDPNTVVITSFAFYRIESKLNDGITYKWLTEQHFYLLFKNADGDAVCNYDAYLRFADLLSARVKYYSDAFRQLLGMTDVQRRSGCPVFVGALLDRRKRRVVMEKTVPALIDENKLKCEVNKLFNQIPNALMNWEVRRRLSETVDIVVIQDRRSRERPLGDALKEIAGRCVRSGHDTTRIDRRLYGGEGGGARGGTDEDDKIAQHMRLLGMKDVQSTPVQTCVNDLAARLRPEMIAEMLTILKKQDARIEGKFIKAVRAYQFEKVSTRTFYEEFVKKLEMVRRSGGQVASAAPVPMLVPAAALKRQRKLDANMVDMEDGLNDDVDDVAEGLRRGRMALKASVQRGDAKKTAMKKVEVKKEHAGGSKGRAGVGRDVNVTRLVARMTKGSGTEKKTKVYATLADEEASVRRTNVMSLRSAKAPVTGMVTRSRSQAHSEPFVNETRRTSSSRVAPQVPPVKASGLGSNVVKKSTDKRLQSTGGAAEKGKKVTDASGRGKRKATTESTKVVEGEAEVKKQRDVLTHAGQPVNDVDTQYSRNSEGGVRLNPGDSNLMASDQSLSDYT